LAVVLGLEPSFILVNSEVPVTWTARPQWMVAGSGFEPLMGGL
jgi:hypothetical protein